jgi:hypothetical protein
MVGWQAQFLSQVSRGPTWPKASHVDADGKGINAMRINPIPLDQRPSRQLSSGHNYTVADGARA